MAISTTCLQTWLRNVRWCVDVKKHNEHQCTQACAPHACLRKHTMDFTSLSPLWTRCLHCVHVFVAPSALLIGAPPAQIMQIKVCDVGTQRPPLHELLGGGERWSGGTHTKKPQRRERLTSRLPPLFMCNLFALSASASLPSAPAGLLPPPVTLPGSLPSGPRALGPK